MKTIIFTLLLICAVFANAQTPIDSILSEIARNNKTLIAHTAYSEARKLSFQTGLTPENPHIDYDYLIGSPANAGNQTDLSLTQSFDFPSVYTKKKQLSHEQIDQAELELSIKKQDIILESKLICIELIYLNKLNLELSERKRETEKLLTLFNRQLEQGEGNILDINKARLRLVEISAAYQESLTRINQMNQKLTTLNGGQAIQYFDTLYPTDAIVPAFDTLLLEAMANDPLRHYLEQENEIGAARIALSKSLTFPKIETGYRYQAILGQRFNGVHVGLSIPLWESKNTVKTETAELVLNEATLEEYNNQYYFDLQQKYAQMSALKDLVTEYLTFFSTSNISYLLEKSLTLGNTTSLEYFTERSFYYEAMDNYLKLEMEYHKILAELYKYKL